MSMIALWAAVHVAQPLRPSPAVRAELSAVNPTIVVAEPLTLRVKITNTGTEPLLAHRCYTCHFSETEFQLSKDGGAYEPIACAWQRDSSGPVVRLNPDGTIIHEETFAADWRSSNGRSGEASPLFREPGVYSIKASLGVVGGSPRVEAGPITVTVSRPVDAETSAILREGIGGEVCVALETGGFTPEAAPRLRTIAQGSSRYAPYLSLAIARGLLGNGYFGMQVDEAARLTAAHATEALDWIARADLDGMHYQASALELKVRALERLKRRDEAVRAKDELLAKHPESESAARMRTWVSSPHP